MPSQYGPPDVKELKRRKTTQEVHNVIVLLSLIVQKKA